MKVLLTACFFIVTNILVVTGQTSPICFPKSLQYSIGETATEPVEMLRGDFNKDGKPDIITINNGTGFNNISYLQGNGDGTFNDGTTIVVGSRPIAGDTGDFNGDNNLDIVVANLNSDNVVILLGSGTGLFSAPVSYSTGANSHPTDVVTGDFNNDHILDIAASNNALYTSIFLGNGDGTFSAAVNQVTLGPAKGICKGDFNSDGKLDLIITVMSKNYCTLLLGKGNGTFVSSTNLTTVSGPLSIKSGFINDDNIIDFIVGNFYSYDMSIFLGKGDGTFLSSKVSTGIYPGYFAFEDLDMDGHRDIITTAGLSVVIYKGNGASFKLTGSFLVSEGASSILAADINQDLKTDIIVSTGSGESIAVLLGKGDASFFNPTTIFVKFPTNMLGGDFNKDGFRDVAVGNSEGLKIFLNDGNGNTNIAFTNKYSYSFPDFKDFVADYVNDDSILDIATLINNNLQIYYGAKTGSGSFSASAYIYPVGTGNMKKIVSGHFNADDTLDFAVINFDNNYVSLFLGTDEGFHFGQAVNYPVQNGPFYAEVSYINGDSISDIVVVNTKSNSISVLLGNESGIFSPAVNYQSAGTSAGTISLNDLDNDHIQDLLVSNSGTSFSFFKGNGDGTFQQPISMYSGSNGVSNIHCKDLNGDQKADIISNKPNTSQIFIQEAADNGTFNPPVAFDCAFSASANRFAGFMDISDFNNDNKPDIAVLNNDDNSISFLANMSGSKEKRTGVYCDSVTLDAGFGDKYVWSTGETTRKIKVTASGVYSATIFNVGNCNSSSIVYSITIHNTTLPNITVSGSTVLCEGESVNLNTNDSNKKTYQWYNGSTPITGQTTFFYKANSSGNYFVKVKDEFNCISTSEGKSIVINPLPVALVTTTSATTICQGESVILKASGGTSYKWYNGNVLQSETSSVYTITLSGLYTVEVSNVYGCKDTSIIITVNVNTPTVWYADIDGDGKGDPAMTKTACVKPIGYIDVAGDECPADANKIIPGDCGCGNTEIDTDNDKQADCVDTDDDNDGINDATDCAPLNALIGSAIVWYADIDGDGKGDPAMTKTACVKPIGYIDVAGDECPGDANKIIPGGCGCGNTEIDTDNDKQADCVDTDDDNDGINDATDCAPLNALIGSATVWYADIDGDGKGDPNTTKTDCVKPIGYIDVAGDECPGDIHKILPGDCGCGSTEKSCLDCAGIPNGAALLDVCNRCTGGNTGLLPVTAISDCNITAVNTALQSNMKIYPNPSESEIFIVAQGVFDVKVYNANGEEILKGTYENQVTLGENFVPGIYMVHIQQDDTLITQKIIKK